MSKRVYSLAAKQGDPRYLQAVQGNYWFWLRGYEVVEFNREQLTSGELDPQLLHDPENTIVYGSVAVVREAIVRAGRPEPANIDFPPELGRFLGRAVWQATMREIRGWEQSNSDMLPVHVKPRDRPKLFAGKVVSSFRDLISLAGVPADEPLLVQEFVDIASEWRVSILRGRVLNVAHYKGDSLAFPNSSMICEAIDAFADAPIGYAMDWGLTSDGRTILVEVNDGFALGNYGVRGHHYTALIEARWRQLMGLDDNGIGCDS
jgi:hypothetical protein